MSVQAVEQLDQRLRVELEMAASGHVSGVLGEWPMLRLAFERLSLECCHGMTAAEARDLACRALGELR